MNKIKILQSLLLILSIAMFTGCGSSSEPSDNGGDTDKPIVNFTGELVILDNDFGFSDPDNDGSLATALSLHNQGYFKILALGRAGHDIQNNGTLITVAQLYYHNLKNIKLGINPNSSKMRQVTTRASVSNPSLNSVYAGDYTDIRQFPSDGCLNNNSGCGNRANVVEVYKEALINAPKKVIIISGAQLYNIAELLRAEPALFAEKVKSIFFVGSSGDSTTGQNFGGGDDYAKWALHYVIENLPATTKLIETSMVKDVANYQKIPNSRVGTIFRQHHIQSPVAFVYGGNHPYGVGLIDGYSIVDTIPVVYAAVGSSMPNGLPTGNLRGVTFVPSDKGAHISTTPNGNHFELYGPLANWGHMKNFIEEVLIAEKEPN